MKSLSHSELIGLLVSISTLLFIGRLCGEFMKKINQPSIVGELIAGIILGPSILGYFFPDLFSFIYPTEGPTALALDGFIKVAVILLLFISGLEVELQVILQQRRSAFFTSMGGIIIPFFFGFWAAMFFPQYLSSGQESNPLLFALFFGTALSISALPVIARTLMDLGIFKTPLGMLILSSAMIDDFLGWMVFSVILSALGQTITTASILLSMFNTLLLAFGMLTLGKYLFNKFLPWINKNFSWPGGVLTVSVTACFIGAATAEQVGIHAIFGSFLVGVAIGDSKHMSEKAREVIHIFVTNIFAPLFFVTIGMKVNFFAFFEWKIVLFVLVLSYLGKVIGCFLAAWLGGYSKRVSWAVGFGMNARGAMEIILASLALQAGLIKENLFVALVVMALITSITSGPLIRWILKLTPGKENDLQNFPELKPY